MNKLLAIETSSEACSVALSIDGEVREAHEVAPLKHAEILLPAVSRLLGEAGIPVSALDVIAFGRGPGSFTSLRIGIGVVQGLAWAAGLPVVPCSSLAAVAQAALDRQVAGRADGPTERVCVAVDARMNEVFCGEFERGSGGLVHAAGEERVCAPGAVPKPAAGPFVAAGNGFARYPDLASLGAAATACHADLWPRASVIARLALAWLTDHEPLPAAQAQPVYIRNNVATKPTP
jgi:tRNA threonylcarbamoyladenosine biosynthesis protein TsaB